MNDTVLLNFLAQAPAAMASSERPLSQHVAPPEVHGIFTNESCEQTN